MQKLTIWEHRLTPEQKLAAEYIVLNNYRLLDKGKKLTQVEVAERVGVADRTIRDWYKKKEFVDYMNTFAHDHLTSHRSEVFDALLGLCTGERVVNKQPSVNAIKLYLQLEGLLRNEVAITDDRTAVIKAVYADDADIDAEMKMLEGLIGEDDE